MREPYLDFLVEVRWPNGRLLREYTVLLDLPVFSGPSSSAKNQATAPGSQTSTRTETAPSSAPTARAAAPAPREYGSNARDEPLSGEEYLVQKDDTLWKIAERARPSGSTVHQTMLDIQRLNPQAFINNNINRLKAGYVLRLPTASEITAGEQEAIASVAAQTRDWREQRDVIDTRLIDSRGPATSAAPEGSAQGRLQISGVEEEDAIDASADLESEVTAGLENLDRAQRENAELQGRLDAMEEQLATVRRLLELKDDQIATLQATLAEQEAAPTEDGVVEGSVEGADDTTTGEDEYTEILSVAPPVPGSEGETATDAGGPGEAAAPAESPAPEPAAPAPVAPPLPAETDAGWSSWLIYIALGALLLVVVAVYLLRDRFSQSEEQLPAVAAPAPADSDDEFAGVELGDDGLIVDEITEAADEQQGTVEELEPIATRDGRCLRGPV